MLPHIRDIILEKCKNGEEILIPKTRPDIAPFKWTIGKLIAFGVSDNGFPYIVWESTNFGSIQVGRARNYQVGIATNMLGAEPKSHIRNDHSCSSCYLNSFEQRQSTAERMGNEIIY